MNKIKIKKIVTLLLFISLLLTPILKVKAKEKSIESSLFKMNLDFFKTWKNTYSSQFKNTLEEWSVQYHRNEEDVSRKIVLDSKENIITAGYTARMDSDEIDFLTLKYDQDGNLLWDAVFNGGKNDYAWDIALDSEDNIILFGVNSSLYAEDISDLNITLFLVKYDEDGVELWNKSIEIEEDGFPGGIAIDSKDNIILTIGKGNLDSMAFFCHTVKMDKDGNELWNTTFTKDMLSIGFDVVVNKKDEIFVGGLVASFFGQGWFLSKYDPSGNLHWTQRYNMGNNLNDLEIDEEGNIIIVGQTFSVESNSTEWITIKCDKNGKLLWDYQFDGIYHESANDAAIDTNGNIFVLGTIFMEESYEHCILVFDPNGNELCMKKPSIDGSYLGITIDSDNTLYATGVINNSDDFYDVDCYTCKFKDNTPPLVDSFSPEPGYLYLFNTQLFPFFEKTVVLGKITLCASTTSSEDIEKVLFYVDGILQHTIESPPYEWTWNDKDFGWHQIEIQVFDENANINRETVRVFKIL